MPTSLPIVAVTALTEVVRDLPRVRVNQAYTDALQRAGVIPVALPPLSSEAAQALIQRVDGLVLTGGEDVEARRYGQTPHPSAEAASPHRDRSELALVHAARARGLPTLAICRGLQIANVAFGGTLIQDIASQRPDALRHARDDVRAQRVHDVTVEPGTRLAHALGVERLTVNSLHHQALDRIGAGLRVAARAADGLVEAAEWAGADWWMVGVQWHPEALDQTAEPWDRALLAAFAAAVSSPSANASRRAPGA